MTPGYALFKLAFQISPIILTNGIAGPMPGGMVPILALTEAFNFPTGLLSGGDVGDLDSFFANFAPMPGATVIDNAIGTYPFANQAVAANAIIAQPLAISLKMICPVRTPGGYAVKLATMMALQATLSQHNNLGGTYIVATPSFFYTNCIMTRMVDVSGAASKQSQFEWQLDFAKPLLSLAEAEQAQNSLMSKITMGTAFDGQPSATGLQQTVNQPASLAAPSLIPAASGAPGAGTAPAVGS